LGKDLTVTVTEDDENPIEGQLLHFALIQGSPGIYGLGGSTSSAANDIFDAREQGFAYEEEESYTQDQQDNPDRQRVKKR